MPSGYDPGMAIHDQNSQRMFIDAGLRVGQAVPASEPQANYLLRVLRLSDGDRLLVFNGRDGEWLAEIRDVAKRGCALVPLEQVRPQGAGPDVHYLFAPLKRSRLDYMVQKAVELGVSRLSPVLTRRTIAERVNLERMRANAIEAAEQCGVLRLPEIAEPMKLEAALAGWDAKRRLIFCDEAASITDPIAALTPLRGESVALLIGPEGGFDPQERALLLSKSFVTTISLGPRIMRADTAAVAALALVNASIGDWR
jgi:16S rRNA (uracil1498-N3)-methyltransferase